MNIRALLIAKCFLAEISDLFLDVEAGDVKVFQIVCQLDYFLAHWSADFKRLRIGVFLQLPNIKCGFAGLSDFDFNEFRCAAVKYPAIGNCRGPGSRMDRRHQQKKNDQ